MKSCATDENDWNAVCDQMKIPRLSRKSESAGWVSGLENTKLRAIAEILNKKNSGWSCAALGIPQFPENTEDTKTQLSKLIIIGVRFGLIQAAESVENEFFPSHPTTW